MPRPTRQPYFWLASYAIWFGVLWWLSSRKPDFPPDLTFQYSDKVLHFGYFFGGAGLLSAFLFRLDPVSPRWGKILLLTVITCGVVGLIDEWHQSFVPDRSGNDPADLSADLIGAFCGALVFRRSHRLIA